MSTLIKHQSYLQTSQSNQPADTLNSNNNNGLEQGPYQSQQEIPRATILAARNVPHTYTHRIETIHNFTRTPKKRSSPSYTRHTNKNAARLFTAHRNKITRYFTTHRKKCPAISITAKMTPSTHRSALSPLDALQVMVSLSRC